MSKLQELIDQKATIEREITKARNEGRAQALMQVVALMTESGLSVDDVVKAFQSERKSGTGTRRPVAAKYRDPNSGAAWSGRGLKPR